MAIEPLEVGLVGCGTISDAYLSVADAFDAFAITACADIDRDRAEAKAAEYGVTAHDVEGLLASEVEAVVNLTPPKAHAEVCTNALGAGKHVYTEKPFAASVADAAAILDTAAERGLRIGSAPDTFLGAGIQTARQVLDEGRIGDPLGATAMWTSPGHETWHPNPDLFYEAGGGPMFDMGPYYVSALVSLLGPAARVAGSVSRGFEERTITSEPRRGEGLDVEVPTHEAGLVDFASGATATVLTSFDVQTSTLPDPCFEIYGTAGTLALPDPNHFEGPVRVCESQADEWTEVDLTHEYTAGRGAGVADLAYAVRSDWKHRTSGELAFHVLEILSGIRESSGAGAHVDPETAPDRPAPLPADFPSDPTT
jgi:predicted dehydrogenase